MLFLDQMETHEYIEKEGYVSIMLAFSTHEKFVSR